jgi:hypothetical protein
MENKKFITRLFKKKLGEEIALHIQHHMYLFHSHKFNDLNE